jgi:hypothetical protein
LANQWALAKKFTKSQQNATSKLSDLVTVTTYLRTITVFFGSQQIVPKIFFAGQVADF